MIADLLYFRLNKRLTGYHDYMYIQVLGIPGHANASRHYMYCAVHAHAASKLNVTMRLNVTDNTSSDIHVGLHVQCYLYNVGLYSTGYRHLPVSVHVCTVAHCLLALRLINLPVLLNLTYINIFTGRRFI